MVIFGPCPLVEPVFVGAPVRPNMLNMLKSASGEQELMWITRVPWDPTGLGTNKLSTQQRTWKRSFASGKKRECYRLRTFLYWSSSMPAVLLLVTSPTGPVAKYCER